MVTAPVQLLWGEDDFLLREAARAFLGRVGATEVDASDWQGGELQDLATPSLFGEPRALLVTDARSLSKDAVAEIASYVQAPDPAAPLVICCRTAERGKPAAALLKAVEGVGAVRRIEVKRKDLEPWVTKRARDAGLDLTAAAARALVETVGQDPAELASAVEQLRGAYGGAKVAPAQVHAQFRGLGEQQTWDLCDRAFGKDLPGAIRALRSIEEIGDDPLKTLGGISTRLRDLIRVAELPERLSQSEVARRAGLRFDWQARRYQQQARNFTMTDLLRFHERITQADRALKSGATGDVVLPVLIATIAA